MSTVPTVAEGFDYVTRFMDELVAFNKHLGITVYHLTSGHCVLRLPPAPFLTGDPMRPAIHGGVLSTLIDTAGGAACFTRAESNDRLSTVDMRVDYLRPGPCGIELWCEGTVVRMGNRVAVARMEVFAAESFAQREVGAPIATGQAVYSVVRAR
ncbi:MAG: hypothetical protein ACI9OJ_004993 [Myxococcota bacterium]|jgi:uncharacterized protein (TIGR00369 family)